MFSFFFFFLIIVFTLTQCINVHASGFIYRPDVRKAFTVVLKLSLNVKWIFVCHSVSVVELLSHSELDKDSNGVFTEAEAQVYIFFPNRFH